VIDKHATHQARGKAVEMLTVFKPEAALTDELQEELVDHAGGLKEVLRTLTPKKSTGNLPKLRIDELEEVLHGRRIASGPIAEKYRNFTRFCHGEKPLRAV